MAQHPPSEHANSPERQHIPSVVHGPPAVQHPPLLHVVPAQVARLKRSRPSDKSGGTDERVVLTEKISKTFSSKRGSAKAIDESKAVVKSATNFITGIEGRTDSRLEGGTGGCGVSCNIGPYERFGLRLKVI